MPGLAASSLPPTAASAANQITMIGPNRTPIAPVPKRWRANRAIRITSEKGTICAASAGEATFSPDTAETTEIAGVSMPSP